jgi:uncharacterized membrane protein YdjX (TVP38/TMEM64 family)
MQAAMIVYGIFAGMVILILAITVGTALIFAAVRKLRSGGDRSKTAGGGKVRE